MLRLLPASALLLVVAAHAQGPAPLAAPGLPVPPSGLPYALDHFQGKPELVPIHHSTVDVNSHNGSNIAGSLAAGVFFKPKTTIELAGEHARTVLHDAMPAIFVHTLVDPDGAPAGPTGGAEFAIVKAFANKDKRVFSEIRHTQLTGNAKRKDGAVETRSEALGDGWVKITPVTALPPGEYGFMPLPKNQNTFSTVVFDFAITPDGPNATDAVMPTADLQ